MNIHPLISSLENLPLKICILNVDYSITDSPLKGVDPPSDPRFYITKNLPWTWEMAFIKKAEAFTQIKKLSLKNFDLYMNFCDGAMDEDRAGVEVVQALEYFNLPYTGCNAKFYKLSKEDMKLCASQCGINIPRYIFAYSDYEIDLAIKNIGKYPMIVKHYNGYCSVGLTKKNKVWNDEELRKQAKIMIDEYGGALIEEFIEGEEYSVLVVENPEDPLEPIIFNPVQFLFNGTDTFKHFDLKHIFWQDMDTKLIENQALKQKLIQMGKESWIGMYGSGFGRLDIRVNNKGEPFFLEINALPKIFCPPNEMGSADFILMHEKQEENVVFSMIKTAFVIHARKQLPYHIFFSDTHGGLGIFAKRDFKAGEVILCEESKANYIMTKKHSEKFQGLLKNRFNNYVYPISDDIYHMWSKKPEEWKPLNHSCDPNMWHVDDSLIIVARYDIKKDEELTMDYATFWIDTPLEFICNCKKKDCRGKFTAQDYKLKYVQEKYKTHFSPYVSSKINKLNKNNQIEKTTIAVETENKSNIIELDDTDVHAKLANSLKQFNLTNTSSFDKLANMANVTCENEKD